MGRVWADRTEPIALPHIHHGMNTGEYTMGLRDFVCREGRLDAAALTLDAWEALEAAESDGKSALQVLEELPPEVDRLPRRTVRSVLAAWRRHDVWREARDGIVARRAAAELAALPDAVLEQTATPSQLRALDVAAEAVAPGAFPDDEAWGEALKAAIDLWGRALSLARRDGELEATLCEDQPAAADFADHDGSCQPLDELPPHRWMALRRGERVGALRLSFTVPEDDIRDQLTVVREALGPGLPEDGDDALLSCLVFDRLPDELRHELDAEAADHAIGAAAEAYAEMLAAPPLSAEKVAGVYVGPPKGPLGLAIVTRDGKVRATARIAPTTDWSTRVKAWLSSEEVTHVVLPTQAPAREVLKELRSAVGQSLTVVAVRPAGLAEARDAILEGRRRMMPEAAAAAVLALRAVTPAQAWSSLDPLRLGLAEYQADIDSDALAAELAVTRALVMRSLPSRLAPRRGGRRRVAPVAAKGNNPLVRSINDLRPGMTVSAVVTNITRFGAFVDLGLAQQGLIHVSDLADHFVRDPGEVVRTGQQVQAHVANVDLSRGRISLSLRTPAGSRRAGGPPHTRSGSGPDASSRSDSGPRSGSGRPSGPHGGRGGGSNRAKALRDLDKLFDR